MAAINFPNSPTQGDTFTANDKTWVYLDGKWAFQTGETPLPVNVATPTSGQFLKWNGTAWVNDTIDLGADTAGSFVASLVAGTGVTLANNSGEASTPTVTVDTTVIAPLASPTFTGTVTVPTPIGNTDASTKAYVDSTASTTASNASTALTNHDADTTNIHGIVDTSILVTTTGTQTLTNKTITSPSGLAKGDVGLGNVDNTSDANKPVSTAQQTALDLKSNLASPTFTGTVTANDLTVSGNLTVSGTTTSINTETLTVNDNIVVLNNNVTSSPTENAGIEIERGSSTNVALRWNETSDKWELTNDGSTYADIATETYAASLTPATLNDIGDVTITSPAAGQTIQWNGSAWVNVTPTGTTVTTTANRSTDIPSPFIGQLIVLTDTKKVQLWDGTAWLNITMAPPETPTSLSAIEAPTSVAISFTAGSANGSPITNYKYALSTDGGSTYGSFVALDPADSTSPITVSGLSMNTTYHVKLKAVNDLGDSVASAAVTFTTEGVPGAPTSLSASNITGSTADIAFTAGAANGASITNYKFAVSTDDITYGAYSALDPVDASTPITVTGLTSGTLQYIKLKAVNLNGDSAASAAVSLTTLSTPGAPTSLSATPASFSVAISFTPGDQGGSAITNYQYALSTNGGSTYGSFTALDPTDATSPITISGLTAETSYHTKLKAVNTFGTSLESSAVSFTTPATIAVDYLVVAGGGGANNYYYSAGAGAGGLRSTVTATGGGGSLETALTLGTGNNYTVSVGAGGTAGVNGGNSVFSSITSLGGQANPSLATGGSGAGAGASGASPGAGTANQGYSGGARGGGWPHGEGNASTGGGGGAGGAGGAGGYTGGNGGSGVAVAISGSSVYYAGGGGGSGCWNNCGSGGSGGTGGGGAGGASNGGNGTAGGVNTGGGGGGVDGNGAGTLGGAGGSGIVILRYPSSKTITIGAGLTGSTATVGGNKVTTLTAGSGNVSWA